MEQRGEIVLAPNLQGKGGVEVVDASLRAFSGYHTDPVLEPRGDHLVLADTRLLFYYQNRLAAYPDGLAVDFIAPKPAARNAAA